MAAGRGSITSVAGGSTTSVWAVSKWLRFLIVAGAVYVTWTGVTIVGAAANEGATWEGVGLAVVLFWIPQLPLLLYAFRSRVEVGTDRLRVVTMFGDRSLAWHEVVDAEPGYHGMTRGLRTAIAFTRAQFRRTTSRRCSGGAPGPMSWPTSSASGAQGRGHKCRSLRRALTDIARPRRSVARLSGSQIERAIPGTPTMSSPRDIRATRNGESRVPAVDDGQRKPPLTCANAPSTLLSGERRII